MARSSIKDTEKKKLYALSGNQCCFPGCTEKVYDLEMDVLLGEMCHISAVNPNGPRFNPNLTNDELNSYQNIILLCPNHHTMIDKNEKQYNEAFLKSMKMDHESKFYNILNKIDEIAGANEGEIKAEALEENVAIEASLKVEKIKKIDYDEVDEYIPRYVISLTEDEQFLSESKTLLETIENENRLTILGVAGSGKSIELQHLAYLHSNENSVLYPVKVRLNILTTESIEELLKIECPELEKIPHNRLLIILDALDEVQSNNLDSASRKIILFGKKYKEAKIVVSCRNNFYTTETDIRSAKLEGFKTFLIKPLEYSSILNYLDNKIDIKPELFVEDLRRKGFYEFLLTPFYLVSLKEYYNSKKEIPESKKMVFEYLISQRIESDYEKFENSGVSLTLFAPKVEEIIEQLAIIGVCLGRNNLLWRAEILPLVSDKDQMEALKCTSLFNKTAKSERWEFGHNNIQEFLTAKFLSRLSFLKIQELVSISPDFLKIKPNWLNSLSFLFSILEVESVLYSQLESWIISIEPDVLVRFEKDKLDLKTRESIFFKIYEEYEKKKIRIRNEKFESDDLALFVSDSYSTIEFLLEKIQSTNDRLIIYEALIKLPFFEHLGEFTKRIEKTLLDKICGYGLQDDMKYQCLLSMSNLKIFSTEISKKILKHNDLDSSKYLRAGFYTYIEASGEADEYLDLLLRGVERIEQIEVMVGLDPNRRPNQRLWEEEHYLKEALKSVKTPLSVKKVLEWSSSFECQPQFEHFLFQQIRVALTKAAELYNTGNTDLHQNVIDLLLSFSRRYYRELGRDFKKFFSSTKSNLDTFKKLYNDWTTDTEDSFDYMMAMAIACNAESVFFLINEIKNNQFLDPNTWRFRNLLSWEDDIETWNLYQNELLKIDPNKYRIVGDKKVLEKSRLKLDIDLLLNKGNFLKEAKVIFKEASDSKKRIYTNELFNWRKQKYGYDEMPTQIVFETLMELATGKNYIELHEIYDLVESNERWLWFQLHKIINLDTSYDYFEYDKRLLNFIKTWVCQNVQKANFKTAIELQDGGNYHHRYLELYISYFTQRLDIELPDELYLEFLYVDCFLLPFRREEIDVTNPSEKHQFPDTIEFLLKKLGHRKVTKKILSNLESKELIPLVKHGHILYCQKYKVYPAVSHIFYEIKNESNKDRDIRLLVTQYLELGGNKNDLMDIVESFDTDLQLYIIEKLIEEDYFQVIDFLITQIKNQESEENKIEFIKTALNTESVNYEVFLLLKEWILKNKELPKHINIYLNINPKNLKDLIDIYEDSLTYNYGTGPWENRNQYLQSIIDLGSRNDYDYSLVRDKLNYWIGKFDGMKYLHYEVQVLEQKYYAQKSQILTFEEARKAIDLDSSR